jgi:hypothetical protein
LEVTEHDRGAVLLRQPTKCFVEEEPKFVVFLRFGIDGVRGVCGEAFELTAAELLRPQFESDAVGHLVQPTPDGLMLAQGTGLSGQGEKSRLKGVLGVVVLSQHTLTDPKHGRAMPPDQGLERCRMVALKESL